MSMLGHKKLIHGSCAYLVTSTRRWPLVGCVVPLPHVIGLTGATAGVQEVERNTTVTRLLNWLNPCQCNGLGQTMAWHNYRHALTGGKQLDANDRGEACRAVTRFGSGAGGGVGLCHCGAGGTGRVCVTIGVDDILFRNIKLLNVKCITYFTVEVFHKKWIII